MTKKEVINNPFELRKGKNREFATKLIHSLVESNQKKVKTLGVQRLAEKIAGFVDKKFPNLGVTDTASIDAIFGFIEEKTGICESRASNAVINEMGGFVSGAGMDNAFFNGLGMGAASPDPAARMFAPQSTQGYANFASTPDSNPKPASTTSKPENRTPCASVAASITTLPQQEEGETGNEDLSVFQDCKVAILELLKKYYTCKHGGSAGTTPSCGCASNQNSSVQEFLRCFGTLEAKINGWLAENKKKSKKTIKETK